MNGYKLINSALSIIFGLGIFTSTQIVAQTQATTHQSIGDCSREFLVAYFPSSLVENALNNANIPKDKWEPITKELTANEKNIVSLVEEKASKITPNPLKDPQQRQVAVKIFKETLLEIFSGVLKKNGITDDKQIQAMLDSIQQEKARKFAECLEKHKRTAIPQGNEAPKKEALADSTAQNQSINPSHKTSATPNDTSKKNSEVNSDDDDSDDNDEYDSDEDDNDHDDYDSDSDSDHEDNSKYDVKGKKDAYSK